MHWVDIVGWIGSILIVVAYWLISMGRFKSHSSLYQGMNIIGSIFLVINTVYYHAYPSSALNVVWAMIGMYWIVRHRNKRENLSRIHQTDNEAQ